MKTTGHPNAAIAGTTTGVGTIVVWLLGRFHVSLSAEEGSVIAGGAATVLLFIGRNGVRGVWRRLMNGNQPPAAG